MNTLVKVILILASIGLQVSHSLGLDFKCLKSEPAGYIEDGKGKGYYFDILNELANRLGAAEPDLVPYGRILSALNNNSGDNIVLTILFKNDKFKSNVKPIYPVGYFPIIIATTDSSLKTVDDFTGKTVGLLRGGKRSYSDDLKVKFDQGIIKTDEINQYHNGIMMLRDNRIDGFLGSQAIILWQAKKNNVSNINAVTIGEKISNLTISIPADDSFEQHKAQIDKIMATIVAMHKEGKIHGTINEYVDIDQSKVIEMRNQFKG